MVLKKLAKRIIKAKYRATRVVNYGQDINNVSVVAGKPKYMLQILPLKPCLFQKIVFFLCKKHFVNKINFPLPVETKFIIISL